MSTIKEHVWQLHKRLGIDHMANPTWYAIAQYAKGSYDEDH